MLRPLLLLLGSLLPVQAAGSGRVWLCVGNPEFLKAARPLIEHRRAEGLRVVTSSEPAIKAIASCPVPPAYVLLLGDDTVEPAEDAPAWQVSASRRPYHGWQASHPATFLSDMAWGDLDGDGTPDAPVGRLPARSAAEVTAGVKKILKWESRSPSLSDLAVPVWAGDPGFAPVFRDMALGFLFSQIRQRSPLWAELWVMQSDERSPFCGWPVDQPKLFNSRLQGGSLVSAMIGHGQTQSWWSMDSAGTRFLYGTADAAGTEGGSVTAPHVIFACACGTFSLKEGDSLAEALFRAPSGPVLCVGASEDSHPLTNYYHSTALLESLATPGLRFGDLWLRSLKKANSSTEPEKEMLIRALEPLFIRKQLNTADLRTDHAALYNIMGDPATRLFTPGKLEAEITVKDGAWHWNVPRPPEGATLLVQQLAPLPAFALGKPAPGREESVKSLTEANARLQFRTVSEIPAGRPWKGVVSGAGTLRLVAISSQKLSVAAARMNPAEPRGE